MIKAIKELQQANQAFSDQIPHSVKGIFVIVVLSLVIAGSILEYKSDQQITQIREDIIEAISNIGTNAWVIVDGVIVKQPYKLFEDLMTMDKHRGHHSCPEMRIRLSITNSSQSITLDVGRDSEIPTEYWIFDPNKSYLECIGSFRTESLSKWQGVKIKTPREIEEDKKKGIQQKHAR